MSRSAVPGQEDFTQQRRTFALETTRALPAGLVDTAGSTFALFIAISVFDLPDTMKAAIISSGSVGLLLSLFIVQLARRLGRAINQLAAASWALSATGFALAALSEHSPTGYFWGCVLAFVSLGLGIPLMSQVYRKHYPDAIRGRLFSIAASLRAGTAALTAWLIGTWMTSQGENFAPLFWCYAAGCIIMSGCVMSMAPVVLRRSNQIHWFDAFRHVGKDRPFRKLLVIWMIFGFGNLMGWALFVEFITNPSYGFNYDASRVGFITSTIPMVVFIVCVVPWGVIFDRMPFYSVRTLANLFFAAGILIYFLGNNFLTLCIGIGLHGFARSGGNILWSLWVTRFADSDRVIEYMSVHSFLTGIRGVIAPIVGYWLVAFASPPAIGIISAAMILFSSMLTLPEMLNEWREWRKD